MSSPSQFSILFICTGNICRSPLAELLMWESINSPSVTVSSAGTNAWVGHQMPAIQQEIAMKLGVQAPENHRAQQLTIQDVEDADLILTMERLHRSEVVQLVPRALKRTFTLREFARSIEFDPNEDFSFEPGDDFVDRLRKLVAAAIVNRSRTIPFDRPEDDDVIDPYAGNEEIYLQARDQIVAALRRIVVYLNRAAE